MVLEGQARYFIDDKSDRKGYEKISDGDLSDRFRLYPRLLARAFPRFADGMGFADLSRTCRAWLFCGFYDLKKGKCLKIFEIMDKNRVFWHPVFIYLLTNAGKYSKIQTKHMFALDTPQDRKDDTEW